MADSQLICQDCGTQFKSREELQEHEKECAAVKYIQGGQQNLGGDQPKVRGAGGGQPGNQPGANPAGDRQGQSKKNRRDEKNQPEKTRSAGGSGGMNQEFE